MGFIFYNYIRYYKIVHSITDVAYTDDLAFLVNTTAQYESLLYSLEQTARSVVLYVNWDKTEFMCFSQDSAIFSLYGKPVRLID